MNFTFNAKMTKLNGSFIVIKFSNLVNIPKTQRKGVKIEGQIHWKKTVCKSIGFFFTEVLTLHLQHVVNMLDGYLIFAWYCKYFVLWSGHNLCLKVYLTKNVKIYNKLYALSKKVLQAKF